MRFVASTFSQRQPHLPSGNPNAGRVYRPSHTAIFQQSLEHACFLVHNPARNGRPTACWKRGTEKGQNVGAGIVLHLRLGHSDCLRHRWLHLGQCHAQYEALFTGGP